MRLSTLCAVTILVLPTHAVCEEGAFTTKQLALIQEMISLEREAAKQEIYAELCQVNPENCTIAPLHGSEVADRAAMIKDSAPDTLVLPSTSITSLFFGPLNDTTSDRPVAGDKANFEIEGSTASSKATIQIGKRISQGGSDGSGSFKNIQFGFSAPLNKKEDITNVATLDGLANAFQASFKFSNFKVHGRRSGHLTSTGDFSDDFTALCRAAGIDVNKEQCDFEKTSAGLKKRGRLELYPRFQALFWDPDAWKSTYGFDATIGYEEFKFRNIENLEKRDSSEVPWSIGANAGFIPPKVNAYFSAGVKFQQAYKATDSRTVCPKESELDYFECITGSIGGPNEKKKHLVYLDARSQLRNIGYSVRLTHDFKNDETGVDLPIYLLKDSKGNLNGGVRLGWTDTDDFSVGVFVGSAFKILN